MKIVYQLTKNGLIKSEEPFGNLIIFKQATSSERAHFLEKHDLPSDVFNFHDMPSIAPRVEYVTSDKLGPTTIFVNANILENSNSDSVEKRLESHIFILSNQQLFWFINEGASNLFEEFLEKKGYLTQTLESIILNAGLISYKHFTKELKKQKETIDLLDYQANHRTSNQILIDVANTERDMVLLEHTIDTQELAFSHLLENKEFLEKLNDENLTHDIEWYNRQVNKLVHLYRDLLDTVSALYSDIMSNSLNKLMKFLSSLSLILASSGLIAELWGMNTGGLPGENSDYGTLILFSVAFIAGLIMYLFLRKNKYFND